MLKIRIHVVLYMTVLWCHAGHNSVNSAKILALFNIPSKSHNIFNRVLTRALAKRGHQVVEISTDVEDNVTDNRTILHLEGINEIVEKNFNYEHYAGVSVYRLVLDLTKWGSLVCQKELETAGARELLRYTQMQKFDLILVNPHYCVCFYGFISKFGFPPVIAISSHGVVPWTGSKMGSPFIPSYIPNPLLDYSHQMSFWERFHNLIFNLFLNFILKYSTMYAQETISREYFKNYESSYWEIEKKFSLFLVNTVVGLDYAQPLTPNVIPVGGMHITSRIDPLPKDLQTFLDKAKNGFIYFSMGTVVKSSLLKKQKLISFLQAFADLPYSILWKHESENISGLPPNVKIKKWVSQKDVLAHPKILLFMNQCGKLSLMEAVYRGVPIVGMPMFLDQHHNFKMISFRGVGVHLDYHTLTKESIISAVNQVLNNVSYRINTKKLSAVMRDHADTALDRAVYWTEYVIRHRGAPHLRPASTELYWHQYLLLDVLSGIVITIAFTLFVTYLVLRKSIKILRKEYKKQVKEE